MLTGAAACPPAAVLAAADASPAAVDASAAAEAVAPAAEAAALAAGAALASVAAPAADAASAGADSLVSVAGVVPPQAAINTNMISNTSAGETKRVRASRILPPESRRFSAGLKKRSHLKVAAEPSVRRDLVSLADDCNGQRMMLIPRCQVSCVPHLLCIHSCHNPWTVVSSFIVQHSSLFIVQHPSFIA